MRISQLEVKVFNLKDPGFLFTLALIILFAQMIVHFFNKSDLSRYIAIIYLNAILMYF